jgi:hypothetical protein
MPLNKLSARPHTAPESNNTAAVERATALLVRGMRESDAPIADIGDALARMTVALAQHAADPAADVTALRAVFASNIATCIENLQSYDRLIQQLAQARDILTGSNARVAGGPANETRRAGTVELF